MLSRNILYCLRIKGRVKLALLCVLSLFNAVAEMLGIGLIIPLIGVLLNPGVLDRYHQLDFITHTFTHREIVVGTILIAIIFYIVKNTFSFFALRYQFKLLYEIYKDVANRLYQKMLSCNRLDALKISKASASNLISAVPVTLVTSLLVPTVILFIESMMVIMVGGLLFFYNFVTAFLIFFIFGALAASFQIYIKKRVAHYAEQAQKNYVHMNQLLNDGVGLLTEIQLYRQGKKWMSRFQNNTDAVGQANCMVTFFGQMPKQLIEAVGVVVVLFVLLGGFLWGASSHWLLVNITIFGAASMRLMPSVNRIMTSIVNIKSYSFIADQVATELQQDKIQPGLLNEERITGSAAENLIVAKDISYQYPKVPTPLFVKQNFTIKTGQLNIFIGPSGVGKSTLLDLAMGFLKPTAGQLRFKGKAFKQLLSDQAGYLPQSVHLLAGTVRENISFAKSVDDQAIWSALHKADIASFVESLPQGLDTMIGEGGVTVSGGQRQRLGIARALCHQPEILFLDEPTAALDVGSSHQVMKTIKHLRGDVTLLMVTHDIDKARQADHIVFVGADKAILQGTYESLLNHSGFDNFIRHPEDG